jgi:cell wall assembly regulator SMI1
MSHAQLLAQLDTFIRQRDPRLAQQLRPGCPEKALTKWLKKIPGETAPLRELYTWHDGTEALRWSEGDTHKFSLAELSLVPGELCIFEDIQRSIVTFGSWAEIAKYHPRIAEAVGRYFPILWDGSDTWLCVDLESGRNHRIVYFELQNDQPFKQAYASFDEFLHDVLRANENSESLRFFEQ